MNLDCIPNVSYQEQLTVILCFVECDEEQRTRQTHHVVCLSCSLQPRGVFVGNYCKRSVFWLFESKRQFWKRVFETFLKRSTELQLNLFDCREHCYNGANMKGKEAGLQASIL